MTLLRSHGVQVDENDDLSSAIELQLGMIVKEKYNADFFILDQYPSRIRPFYTMPNADNPMFSNSYDMFIRGQEICSGAQRCHDVVSSIMSRMISLSDEPSMQDLLEQRIRDKGMDLDPFKYYIESFRHGVSPHAGAGIGLERVVFLYLGKGSCHIIMVVDISF